MFNSVSGLISIIIIATLLGLIFFYFFPNFTPNVPEYTPEEKLNMLLTETPQIKTFSDTKILGWIPYWDQSNAFDSFKNNAEIFDYISLFWYYLDSNEKIKKYTSAIEDENIINFAHQKGVKVLAVIANLPDYTEGGDWNSERVEEIISSASLRQRHINDIVELVRRNNFDGVDIDYEALKKTDRNNFTIFIKELSKVLHNEGKLLGVAIHPKTSENKPSEDNGSHAQDWEKLHPYIDQMYFMLYSEYNLETKPGPNASVNWADKILDYAVNKVKVPKEKIFFGIPFYGHEWVKTEKNQYQGLDSDVTFSNVKFLSEDNNLPFKWDEASKTPYFVYTKNGKEHIIWFENSDSFEAKLFLKEKYGIPNLGFWRLGAEDLKVWEILRLSEISNH